MSTKYESFAYYYDTFMDNIPYENWSQYIVSLFRQHHITTGTLVELGCGTGTLCKLISKEGYNIIGIDNSVDMLSLASDKLQREKQITLLLQDMQDMDLGCGIYDGFYCVCDSLNYLLTTKEVLQTFQKIKSHLRKDGIFLFDIKTRFFYEFILGDQVFCDHQDTCSYIWENSFFEEDGINQYDLTIFAKEENTEFYRKYNEVHHQKSYSLPQLIDLLDESGLEYVTALDAFTYNPPREESERIYIIARNGEA